MDGADAGRWSAVAASWAELWGSLATPFWELMTEAAAVRPGTRVVDVGCGTGDLLAHMEAAGALTAGLDPAMAMVELARNRVPRADVRLGTADRLPWSDEAFDLATSVNALQFAEDMPAALRELARVTRRDGLVAVANWAASERNDLDTIEEAVARATGRTPLPGGPLREPGGLTELFTDCRLEIVAAGDLEVPWAATDDDALIRAVLLGEAPGVVDTLAPVVLDAARSFRTSVGGYLLTNAFQYAIGRRRRTDRAD